MKEVSEERKAEIEAEKEERRKELENMTVDDVLSTTGKPTEREYAKKFMAMYKGVRKALVLIQEKRKLSMISNEEAYEQALELFATFEGD